LCNSNLVESARAETFNQFAGISLSRSSFLVPARNLIFYVLSIHYVYLSSSLARHCQGLPITFASLKASEKRRLASIPFSTSHPWNVTLPLATLHALGAGLYLPPILDADQKLEPNRRQDGKHAPNSLWVVQSERLQPALLREKRIEEASILDIFGVCVPNNEPVKQTSSPKCMDLPFPDRPPLCLGYSVDVDDPGVQLMQKNSHR
jgi:hypothetical protein